MLLTIRNAGIAIKISNPVVPLGTARMAHLVPQMTVVIVEDIEIGADRLEKKNFELHILLLCMYLCFETVSPYVNVVPSVLVVRHDTKLLRWLILTTRWRRRMQIQKLGLSSFLNLPLALLPRIWDTSSKISLGKVALKMLGLLLIGSQSVPKGMYYSYLNCIR